MTALAAHFDICARCWIALESAKHPDLALAATPLGSGACDECKRKWPGDLESGHRVWGARSVQDVADLSYDLIRGADGRG